MFAQLAFYLGSASDQKKLVDLPVITKRHHGAGNKVRRTKVTAHRIEGDLHQCKSLRTLVSECKVKIVAASLCEARRCPIFLRASTPVARDSSRRLGRRCETGRRFRTVDTCSDARHATGSLLCACVSASWMFCVLGLPWVHVTKASLF